MPKHGCVLIAICTSVKFLARQGLSTRVHTDKEGNLIQLLKLWLFSNSNHRMLSHDIQIQGEMLTDISYAILRHLQSEITTTQCFSIICDRTNDM